MWELSIGSALGTRGMDTPMQLDAIMDALEAIRDRLRELEEEDTAIEDRRASIIESIDTTSEVNELKEKFKEIEINLIKVNHLLLDVQFNVQYAVNLGKASQMIIVCPKHLSLMKSMISPDNKQWEFKCPTKDCTYSLNVEIKNYGNYTIETKPDT